MQVLPYIEMEALAKQYVDFNKPGGKNYYDPANLPVTTTRIVALTCPRDTPAPASETWNGTSYHNYAVNFGKPARARVVGLRCRFPDLSQAQRHQS